MTPSLYFESYKAALYQLTIRKPRGFWTTLPEIETSDMKALKWKLQCDSLDHAEKRAAIWKFLKSQIKRRTISKLETTPFGHCLIAELKKDFPTEKWELETIEKIKKSGHTKIQNTCIAPQEKMMDLHPNELEMISEDQLLPREEMKKVMKIDFDKDDVDAQTSLVSCGNYPTLCELRLRARRLSHPDQKGIIQSLQTHTPALKTLTLKMDLTDALLVDLFKCLLDPMYPQITSLSLVGNKKITSMGGSIIAILAPYTSVKQIKLEGTQIDIITKQKISAIFDGKAVLYNTSPNFVQEKYVSLYKALKEILPRIAREYRNGVQGVHTLFHGGSNSVAGCYIFEILADQPLSTMLNGLKRYFDDYSSRMSSSYSLGVRFVQALAAQSNLGIAIPSTGTYKERLQAIKEQFNSILNSPPSNPSKVKSMEVSL